MKIPKGLLVFGEPRCYICIWKWTNHYRKEKKSCIKAYKRGIASSRQGRNDADDLRGETMEMDK